MNERSNQWDNEIKDRKEEIGRKYGWIDEWTYKILQNSLNLLFAQ